MGRSNIAVSSIYKEVHVLANKFAFVSVPAPNLKQVKIHVETLHSTKIKEQKSAKKGTGKKGSTVKMDLSKVRMCKCCE